MRRSAPSKPPTKVKIPVRRVKHSSLAWRATINEINYLMEMVDPRGEELNRFFQTLEDWESHLAQHDLNGLECENEGIQKQ